MQKNIDIRQTLVGSLSFQGCGTDLSRLPLYCGKGDYPKLHFGKGRLSLSQLEKKGTHKCGCECVLLGGQHRRNH